MTYEEKLELAKRLKALWPTGPKINNVYWADNEKLIVPRLDMFFRRFGEFPVDEIYLAAKRYVDKFGEDTTYMRVLKYFIIKKTDDGGFSSDLLEYLTSNEE